MPVEIEPYVGCRPFEERHKRIFFGRKREESDLVSLVIAHRCVLLYAQSGAGKSSLLNAGLIPILRDENLDVLPVARVQGLIPDGISLDTLNNPFVFNTLMSWSAEREAKVEPGKLTNVSLSDFLAGQPRRCDEESNECPRVIVFDQFEELFTAYPERWPERKEFFQQVSNLLRQDPSLRVLLGMREDFIAQLDPYVSYLSENLRIHFRLECLRRSAALEAIKGPLETLNNPELP